LNYARRVTEANLKNWVSYSHWQKDESACHRVLGDLDFDSGNHESARAHYESALKIARSIQLRFVLIEALLARGRFFAKAGAGSPRPNDARPGSGDPTPTINDAFNDLNEALNYAVEGGYRIYEADIRVALAWAYLANGEKEKAKQSAQRALQMSQEMGYHWGKVDAREVLERIESRE
jgi:tetratricopeptide (TPR) repeat protein